MNAHSKAITNLASALMGQPVQTIHVCKSTHHRGNSRYVVLVDGETYEVGKRTLQALQDGWTPESLDLEPHVEDPDPDEPDGDYCAKSVLMRASGWRR